MHLSFFEWSSRKPQSTPNFVLRKCLGCRVDIIDERHRLFPDCEIPMTFFGEFLIESCNRQVSQKVRGVLPRFSVANPLLAQNVMDRFVYGMTVGTISARTGIGKGTLFGEYARLSERRISKVPRDCPQRISTSARFHNNTCCCLLLLSGSLCP